MGVGVLIPPGCSDGGRGNTVSSLRQQREIVLQIAHIPALRCLQHLVALDACKQSVFRTSTYLMAAYRRARALLRHAAQMCQDL